MNALPLPQPPKSPRSRRSRAQQAARRPQRTRVLAAEAAVKLGVNVLISSAAITALVQLIPYSINQQAKLKEIQAEVNVANARVSRLKAQFSRYFDPHQASTIVQEQANRIAPDARPVVFSDIEPPTQKAAVKPAQNP